MKRYGCLVSSMVFAVMVACNSQMGSAPTSIAPPDPASDRATLSLLYHSTSGDDWTDRTNWLSDRPLGQWGGIETDDAGHVVRIQLSENNLTGEIPLEIGNLTNLTHLYVHSNRLDGPIPPELGNLTNLNHLDLGDNNMIGTIPAELGNLNVLELLDLRSNRLDGPIPSELGNLVNLGSLDLYGNNLTGWIPPELGNLSKLVELDLRSNMLDGEIPPDLGNLHSVCPASTILADLSSISFAGSPPWQAQRWRRPGQSRRVAVLRQSGSWGRRIPG